MIHKEVPIRGFKLTGLFHMRIVRNGKTLKDHVVKNDIVNVGLDYLLDQMFVSLASASGWYIGLINDTSFTSLSNADTMSSHAGWLELTDYNEETRPAWVPSSIGSQAIINSTQATFTMNATKTVKGILIANNATRGGTAGTLWSTALLGQTIAVEAADIVLVNYKLTASRG